MPSIAHRVLRFVRQRTLLLVLVPVLLWLGVVVHELFHAAAVALQGGDVIDLQLLPVFRDSGVTLGMTIYGDVPLPELVWVAPTICWLLIALTTLALLPRIRPPRLAELALLALVILPMLDVTSAFLGLLLGVGGADLYRAFAGQTLVASLLVAATLPAIGLLTWRRIAQLSSRKV